MKGALQIFLLSSSLCCSSLAFTPPQRHAVSSSLYSSKESEKTNNSKDTTTTNDDFITNVFNSDINDVNIPPSLNAILKSLDQLASGSDIRGKFVDHKRQGNAAAIGHSISKSGGGIAALTPFAAYCLGHAFAKMLMAENEDEKDIVICLGRDPRPHGIRLADSFSRGAEGASPNVRVVYTGIATTPAMFDFCRSSLCDGGVMVTASHLPVDKNGLKFFSAKQGGGFTNSQITEMIDIAKDYAHQVYDQGIIPATSGHNAMFCSEWVDWMLQYESGLKKALKEFVGSDTSLDQESEHETLKGLKIVMNSGNGSGGFFVNVLKSLGADVSASINIDPDATFPNGVPNPENTAMAETTIAACQAANADLGIMLDTDADRCGLIVPRTINEDGTCSDYEPLSGNRLIALMGVIFARESPGCAIVTDSVTSEGLTPFLEKSLGLKHVRYLRGYANVINKARSLTENNVCNAEVAIETSGHCALKENDYLDDGTYTAARIIGLLAKERSVDATKSLLDLISNLQEMDEVAELRMSLRDESLESTIQIFDLLASEVETNCDVKKSKWVLDKDNLEGVRVSTGDGGYFMLRKSLHDPVISLQVEAMTKDAAKTDVIQPLLEIFQHQPEVLSLLDFSSIVGYNK